MIWFIFKAYQPFIDYSRSKHILDCKGNSHLASVLQKNEDYEFGTKQKWQTLQGNSAFIFIYWNMCCYEHFNTNDANIGSLKGRFW